MDCLTRRFTAVIPVRDNTVQLFECLNSLAQQTGPRNFNALVIDDGSKTPVPAGLMDNCPFPLKVIRQEALGIAAARNTGIHNASGEIILFVDSDVVLHADFLVNLSASIEDHPEDSAFQAGLCGGKVNLVERMEGLRLKATLASLCSSDGHINYANTSAFAIRRSLVDSHSDFFNLSTVRGEDTIMLHGLIRRGIRPRFVAGASAVHRPRLPLLNYVFKHLSIGYYTAPAREALSQGPEVLLGFQDRGKMFRRMLEAASSDMLDRLAVLLVGAAYLLECTGRASHRILGVRKPRHELLSMPVDGIRESELVARIFSSAERGEGMYVTYLTAWTLVQGMRDSSIGNLFRKFSICYSDGMGVVLCSALLSGRRIKKVTANVFLGAVCRQAALKGLPVALIGAREEVIKNAAQTLKAGYPEMNLVGYSGGFFSREEETELQRKLLLWKPRIVIVGMGQPAQEQWVLRMRESLPAAVFLCVGGLFDYVAGRKPTPPKLIRNTGLEWLYLLILRPKQFWRRYVFGLPMLAFFIVREHASRLLSFVQAESKA